jgi:general secretion pathway protein M
MTEESWRKLLVLQRPGAIALYVALVVLSFVVTITSISSIAERRANIAAEEHMLAQLAGHSFVRKGDSSPLGAAPSGSPFLQGRTVNVAGAALLQRVAGAITGVGGNVLSSQVDLQKADAKDGWVGLVVSCEIEQSSLQQLLYDIEAGMPFLFIDQLVVDAPETGAEGDRLKVLLSVSGQWLSNNEQEP